MLLAVDAGNTNITIGVFEERKLTHNWRLSTVHERTADEFGGRRTEDLGARRALIQHHADPVDDGDQVARVLDERLEILAATAQLAARGLAIEHVANRADEGPVRPGT
jgi:hypothetical protein